MTAVKQKQIDRKTKHKTAHNLSEVLNTKTWSKVKIKGNVISDDGGGFEGLIGLEVLEQYDPALVGASKAKRSRKEQRMERKKQAKKQKLDNTKDDVADEDIVDGSDTDDEDEDESIDEIEVNRRTRKDKLAERTAKRIEKQKEKRDKRKKSKLIKKGKKTNNKQQEEYPPERFALLRPPASPEDVDKLDRQQSDDEEAPALVSAKETIMDELVGWNGLGVPQPILRALAEKGFKSPTEIQALTLPAAILGKKDILGAAETGSGKTLAFGIPILAGIMELKAKNARTGIRKMPKIKGKQQEESESNSNKENRELTPPPEEVNNFPELATDDEEDNNEANIDEDSQRGGPLYAVVLTPTRELAVQIKEHLMAAAKYTGIKIVTIFGGLAVAKQERLLRKCPEIVVATPGRFWELYQQENPHLTKTDDISFLVIDETDRMIEKDHFEELRGLLKILNADESKKQSRQNFVFSATLTLVHDLPEHMQKRNLSKRAKLFKQTPGMKIQHLIDSLGISQPKVVDITSTQQTALNLTECRLLCPIEHKDYYLYYFLQRHPGRTIVFCNSIDCVKRLATLFGLLKCGPLPLHANMIQKQRLKNLERFRVNPNGLLIATDVAARGLDIPNVEHVIHYQVPRTSENYVHRSGRTARADKHGITVMFMEPGEVKTYVKLHKTLDRTEDLPLFPVAERYMSAVKERVNLAREVDKEELKLRRTQTELGWMKKHAEDMELIIDGYNDESGSDQEEDAFIIERRRNRVRLDAVRADLKSLLSKQIFPKGFSSKYPTSSGQLQMPDIAVNNANSAVKVMKAAIEDAKLAKKMRNKKRKLT